MFPSNSNSSHNRTLLFVKSMLISWGDPGSPVNGRRSVSGYTEGDTVTYTNTQDIYKLNVICYTYSWTIQILP